MYDFEIAFFLYKISKIYDIFLDSPYRAKAYFSAAMALDSYDKYIEKVYLENKLRNIPYIGVKIEACIKEIIETGDLKELKQLEEQFKIKDYSLILGYGLNNLNIKKLFTVGVFSATALLDIEVMKELKSQFSKHEYNRLYEYVNSYRINKDRYLLAYGECLGIEIIDFIKVIKTIKKISLTGDIRLSCKKITCIEILVAVSENWKTFAKKIEKYNRVFIKEVNSKQIIGYTVFGIPFIIINSEDDFYQQLVFTTGSKEFYSKYFKDQDNIYKVNSYDSEADVFASQEVRYLPPEARETLNLANNKHISNIELDDIKGDLHSHTIQSDGINSIEEMALEAEKRGYQYFAITDHSVSLKIANGLSETEALNQIEKIKKFNQKSNIEILAGIEVDILADGTLDYSDDVLSQFDFVIVAIHSNSKQPPLVLLDRLEKALSNKFVNILAHPTGVLLGRPGVLFSERPPYDLNISYIIKLCKENNVVLEINCFPERFDLDKNNILAAIEQGVKVSLGTDSHSVAHLKNIEFGVKLLKGAGANKKMVLNTYTCIELMDFFNTQRERTAILNKNKIVKKDFYYYFSNNDDIINGKVKIVGIDLTGSESKASGWAYLSGNKVLCQKINTDKEIIELIEKLNPDIVSIDSPLAYPIGRCCSKKDCDCRKFGIMRESEKLLRHFGIHVYPCLIDSMIPLTTRGMRLAKTLRDMGYKVIESYPGVAQDILEISRKGKTIEKFTHLKKGLSSFGITGDLIENLDISHDEVDAITSALVGYFYLNNQYVDLGNDEEDYLIVPQIKEELLNKKVIIGLSGETASGKTTVAEYLRFKFGFKSLRYSQIISKKYGVTDKSKLQDIGAKIASDSESQRELTKYLITLMDNESSHVIDGLRHKEDYEELHNFAGTDFYFIYIDTNYGYRYKRYNKLKKNIVSEEEFWKINNHSSENRILELHCKADSVVKNNDGFKDLRKQIDKIINSKIRRI